MRVAYSVAGAAGYTEEGVFSATTVPSRDSVYLPSNAKNVRFQRIGEGTTPYLFLDAIEVSQQPEFGSFSPAFGVPGTEVIITGVHLNETSQVFFGAIAATLNPSSVSSDQIIVNVPTGAVSGPIRVITPYGEASSATDFEVPAPEFADAEFTTETEFSPTSAGPGDEVTLNGRYFTGVTGVKVGGVDAAYTFEDGTKDTRLTITIPLAAVSGPITVATPAGTATSTEFTVLGPQIGQVIEEEGSEVEFTPATGAVDTEVTIYGKYFLAATDVFFNGVPAEFDIVSDNEITATVPLGASTGIITVKSAADEGITSTEFELPAPAFADYNGGEGIQFEPTSAGPGMQIVLWGTNLASASQVVFLGDENDTDDDREVAIERPLTGNSNTRLVVQVPADAKTGRIRIDAPGLSGTIVSVESEQTFTFVAAPTIASVANTTGDLSVEDGQTFALVGDEVTITGTNFETATTVTIGNATVERANDENVGGFAVINEGTQIVFTVPTTITKSTGIVKVNTLGGEAIWDGTFDVILAPVISTVEPLRGPRGGKITLTGSNLKYVSDVVFLGESGTPDEGDARVIFAAPNASDTELKFVIPANAETGELLVINPADETETAVFTIVRSPEVLAITPTEGAAGTAVTMTGYNFLNEVEDGGATTVTFVGEDATAIPAANLQIASDSTMTFNVPAGAITGVITVANNFGSDASGEFFIYQLPTITSFTPARGIVGNEVEITGTNFYAQGMVVTFLGDENDEDDDVTINVAPTAVNVQDQKITVTVPSDAVTGKLMVTNTAGDSAPSTGTYEVVRNPEIISFTPNQGKAATPATVVTITGWLLNQGVTAVDFNGAEAAATYNPDGTLTVTVPTGAQTGQLTLIVNGERGHTSEDTFIVIPEPSIYSFDPTSGVGGTEVTITGTNFEGITGILFNEAEVEDLTSIVLDPVVIDNVTYQRFKVNVPADATTGPITIIARGGTVESEDDFLVPAPANITFTPSESYADQLVTISGKFFTNIDSVTFNGVRAEIIGTVVRNGEIESFTVEAPFDAGVGPIAITTPAGTGTSTGNYTVIEPVIDEITVTQGYAEITLVTIKGTNFTTYFDGTSVATDFTPIVRFNGTLAEIVDDFTDQEITVKVPVGATSGSISVESGSGIGYSDNFTILVPVIASIEPNPAYAGQTVTIRGTNFIDVQGVSFKGTAIENYTVVTAGETEGVITFVAPFTNDPGNSGVGKLEVRTLSGSSVADNNFTVIKPIITSVTPNRVYAGIGTEVTITGNNFRSFYNTNPANGAVGMSEAAPTVRFNGTTTDATVVSSTETQIVAIVPAGASTSSTAAVTVQSGSGVRRGGSLTIIGAPTITSLDPTSSLVNNSLTIKGTNLDQATSVTFLGRSDNTEDDLTITTGFTVNATGTEITLNVPANTTAGRILVTTPRTSGTNTATSDIFRIVKAPVITSIDETEQQALQTITLNGANLWDLLGRNGGNISVWFRGHGGNIIPATTEQVRIPATVTDYDDVNGDWVTVQVPRDAITGVIEVENAAGPFVTTAPFTVTSPVIVRFEKANGDVITEANPVRINETVRIRGYQLEDIGTIRVDTRNILSFTEIDPSTVSMVVRQGARTNPVVITSLGYEETSAPVELHIARPTITVSKSSLTFDVVAGETSEMQEYTVSASYLAVGELDVNLALPAISAGNVPNNFEMSRTGEDGTWGRSITLTGATDGTLAPTTIYVRSNPPAEAESDQNGVIIHGAFDAASVNVTLNSRITPLPVELIAFNATKQGNGVQLTWATASELDNDYFEVQMTEDLKGEFKAVGKVNSKVNTTSLRQDYQFNHKGNFNGTRYYRLKQVDLDGTFEYSKVVAVSSNGVNLAVGPRVYPNPINADSKLVFNADRAGKLNVRIVNMNGSAVQNLSYDIEEGENTIILNLNNNLPTGIYILMTEFNGKTEQVKLLKQ
ncbi:IPT/TIG domain-containing protein [uncultured Pontibacter sp.]|uniref:IPT/TIG domain-containing protein n=1 Tax=uncultured Pontibacter sp. TaxID=453356 RepID=UPI00262A6AF9|nr:IPT/TIG domain-containing protein [uncultured Pontibacter sp.]